jgi:hypothetical protein
MPEIAAGQMRALARHLNPVGTGTVNGQDGSCSDDGQAFSCCYPHDVFLDLA